MHDDELAWAACELFLATGEAQYKTKLMEWFPNPADQNTFRHTWVRLSESWGAAIRSYAFAARSGRLDASQLDAAYLAKCEEQIKLSGADMVRWSKENAYGTSFPDHTKRYLTSGWYFGMDQAADAAAAYTLAPSAELLETVVANMNYEGGTNPVNVAYLTGVGLKRQQQLVNQYAIHEPRKLPPIGFPIGNVSAGYGWGLPYVRDGELASIAFPSDNGNTNITPFYDRWTDVWNVSNEFVTVNQSRGLTSAVFLALQTSAKTNAWKPTTTAKIVVTAASLSVGKPITLSLDTAGLDLTNARITWEAKDHQPDYGSTFIVTPKTTGAHWAEAEISWPDGRRVFATGTFSVQ
jgi:hypothetical protein